MSSARPYRPSAGTVRRNSAPGPSAGFMSVSIRPPCTTLTVIPRGPRSRARPLVRPISADLVMAYSVRPAVGTRSVSALPIMMIRPPSPMCRAAAWAATSAARTLTAHSRSACSTVAASSGPPVKMPALLTRMSSRPRSSTVRSTAAATARMTSARPPSASICLATAWALSALLAYVSATAAPSLASRWTIAAPIPRLPPVTRATLPASSPMSCSLRDAGCTGRPAGRRKGTAAPDGGREGEPRPRIALWKIDCLTQRGESARELRVRAFVHPDHQPAALAGRLGLALLDAVQPVAELARDGGARRVRLVAVDLDPAHPRQRERDVGDRCRRRRAEAPAGLGPRYPVADLDGAGTTAAVPAHHAHQRALVGGQHRVDVADPRLPHLIGLGHPRQLAAPVGQLRGRPRHPRAQVLQAASHRGGDRARIRRPDPAQNDRAGIDAFRREVGTGRGHVSQLSSPVRVPGRQSSGQMPVSAQAAA